MASPVVGLHRKDGILLKISKPQHIIFVLSPQTRALGFRAGRAGLCWTGGAEQGHMNGIAAQKMIDMAGKPLALGQCCGKPGKVFARRD